MKIRRFVKFGILIKGHVAGINQ